MKNFPMLTGSFVIWNLQNLLLCQFYSVILLWIWCTRVVSSCHNWIGWKFIRRKHFFNENKQLVWKFNKNYKRVIRWECVIFKNNLAVVRRFSGLVTLVNQEYAGSFWILPFWCIHSNFDLELSIFLLPVHEIYTTYLFGAKIWYCHTSDITIQDLITHVRIS